jgi:hypothetical protein
MEEQEEPKDCMYKNQIIKIKTDSLENEINKSELIKGKLKDSKYLPNFSYISKFEKIEISQITNEITTCNLPKDTSYEYILCNYTNTSEKPILISDFLKQKSTLLDIKILLRIIIDFHITLHEALDECYKKTKIVHHLINENNIIISEEEIPIIQNFKEAKIMEPDEKIKETNETSESYDTYCLYKTFLTIINNVELEDKENLLSKYKETLEKIINTEKESRSIKPIMNLSV